MDIQTYLGLIKERIGSKKADSTAALGVIRIYAKSTDLDHMFYEPHTDYLKQTEGLYYLQTGSRMASSRKYWAAHVQTRELIEGHDPSYQRAMTIRSLYQVLDKDATPPSPFDPDPLDYLISDVGASADCPGFLADMMVAFGVQKQ